MERQPVSAGSPCRRCCGIEIGNISTLARTARLPPPSSSFGNTGQSGAPLQLTGDQISGWPGDDLREAQPCPHRDDADALVENDRMARRGSHPTLAARAEAIAFGQLLGRGCKFRAIGKDQEAFRPSMRKAGGVTNPARHNLSPASITRAVGLCARHHGGRTQCYPMPACR